MASLIFDFSFAQFDGAVSVPKKLDVSALILNNKNKVIANGEYDVRFAIYPSDRRDASQDEGSPLWQESHKITFYNGILRTFLGTENPLPDSINFSTGEYYVGIKVGNDSEMVPRKRIGSVPLALEALSVGGATPGTGAGDLVQLGTNAKINISNLPTGKSGNTLVLSNDSRLKEQTFEITAGGGYDYITADGDELSLHQIDLATDVTNTLPASKGGTGIASYSSGDLVYHSAGSNLSKLSVGNNGEILTVVGGLPSWQAAAGGNAFSTLAVLGQDNVVADAANDTLTLVAGTNMSIATSALGDSVTFNATDTNTTYTAAAGNLLSLAGTEFSFRQGTLTDGRLCSYDLANNRIICDTAPGVLGITYSAGSGLTKYISGDTYFKLGGTITEDTSLNLYGGGSDRAFRFYNSDSGAELFYIDSTTSRIGIGLTNPSFSLHVANSLGVGGTAYFASNVGIGTSAPNNALQVVGTIYGSAFSDDGAAISADTAQAFLSSGLTTGLVKVTNGTGALATITDNSANWDSAYSASHSAVTLGGLNYLTLAGQLITAGTVDISSHTNLGVGNTSIFTLDGDTLNPRIGTLTDTKICTYSAADGLVCTSDAAAINYWQINSGLISPATISNSLSIGSTASTSAMLYVPGTTNNDAWFNLGSGNVGIGTTNPGYKLDIAGTLGVSGTATFTGINADGSEITAVLLNASNQLVQRDLGTAAFTASTAYQATDATLTSIALLGTAADKIAYTTGVDTWAETTLSSFGRTLIDDSDNSVARTTLGLGTMATATEANYALLAGRGGGQILIGGTGPNDMLTLQATSGNATTGIGMNFNVGNNGAIKAMTILNSGNVGIGTTNPGQLLSVAGTLGIAASNPEYYTIFQGAAQAADVAYTLPTGLPASNKYLRATSSGVLSWETVEGGTGGIGTVTSVATGNGLTGGPITDSGTISIDLLGVGTTSATTSSNSGLEFVSSKLSLLHGCSNTQVLSWDSALGVWKCDSVSGIGGLSGSGTSGYITKYTGSNTLGNSVLFETGGKIGIGTTDPETKLAVIGAVSASEYFAGISSGSTNIRATGGARPGVFRKFFRHKNGQHRYGI